MKFFMDLEFLEGTQNKTFLGINVGKTKPTIDLISIGIVSEEQCDTKYDCGGKDNPCRVCSNYNSRSYYAISKDFNLKEAWNRFDWKKKTVNDGIAGAYKEYWLRENVLKPIFKELAEKDNNTYFDFCNYTTEDCGFNLIVNYKKFTYHNLKKLINKYGKINKQIAEEIKDFCKPDRSYEIQKPTTIKYSEIQNPEFYAYYADYDWVAFCWLFGKMIDLPNGFPMFCIDLKQESDRIYNLKKEEYTKGGGRNFINKMSNHLDYPKQTNEHNALADARFNYELYKFLNKL